jgi:hypothetical protein
VNLYMDTDFDEGDTNADVNLDTDCQIQFVDLIWGKLSNELPVNSTMKIFIVKKLAVNC